MMQAHTQLQESATNGPRGLHVALMTCGTVAAVALVVATLAWNSGWGRSAADRVATGQSAAQRDDTGATAGDPVVLQVAPTMAQPTSARPQPSDLTVYMVGSQAEATRVVDVISEGNRILDQFGRPPFKAQAVVAASAEEEAWIEQTYAEVNAQRAGMGLTPIALIDLRSGRSAADGGPTPISLPAEGISNPASATKTVIAGSDPATTAHLDTSGAQTEARAGAMMEAGPILIYVVASQEQAELVRRMSAELSELRSQLGQRQVKTAVMLAGDQPVETSASLPGPPGTRVIDLRAR